MWSLFGSLNRIRSSYAQKFPEWTCLRTGNGLQCSICCSNAASAADMFDFQQSLMSVGGSKLAEMDLMFVDPGVKDQWCTLPYKSLRLWCTEAAYAQNVERLGAKHDLWCKKRVEQISPQTCICPQGEHSKHLCWLKTIYMLTFSLLFLWTLKVNWHSWAKYIRVLLLLISCISQGSVMTHFRSEI